MSHEVLKFVHVRKHYNGGCGIVKVFEDLNFKVHKGEFVAVLGSTGCGKTTLVRLAGGLDFPDAGDIYIDNLKINGLTSGEMAKLRSKTIGIVQQQANIIPHVTVEENVELPLIINGMNRNGRRTIVRNVIEQFGLSKITQRLAGILSVGERQLVSMARTFAMNPDILIMDEPTEFLDPATCDAVLGMAKSRNILSGKTFMVTTHNRNVAQAANRIFHLRKRSR